MESVNPGRNATATARWALPFRKSKADLVLSIRGQPAERERLTRTVAPVQYDPFTIPPPIPTWLSGLSVGANNFLSIVNDVAASLLSKGP
jgi:hypothetical protein